MAKGMYEEVMRERNRQLAIDRAMMSIRSPAGPLEVSFDRSVPVVTSEEQKKAEWKQRRGRSGSQITDVELGAFPQFPTKFIKRAVRRCDKLPIG